MSFQGDVRGIGLAELLQGLARGRREGTLSLTSKIGVRCTLGLADGSARLLPAPDEDPEIWRGPVRDAWADEPDQRLDHLRIGNVPHARRLEDLYRLLDGEGVHFRFEPGAVKLSTTEVGPGVPVEHLLLEYARVGDELQNDPLAQQLEEEHVPCPSTSDRNELGQLAEACNSVRTLREVADRLGLPLRQARLATGRALRAGSLRLAHPGEMLMQGLAQLAAKNFSRAAVRISTWCRCGEAGPLPIQIAERIAGEWQGGHLTAAFRLMRPRDRRILLRRMHPRLCNPTIAAVHWQGLEHLDPEDRGARLGRIHTEARDGSDPERPAIGDLLGLAREFRESKVPARGSPLLLMAAETQPTDTELQLELGMGMVIAGQAEHGTPWVLSGGRDLLNHGRADHVLGPLHALLKSDPRNRECRQLLARARRESSGTRRLRKHILVGVAITAVVASAAAVEVHRNRTLERNLAQVRALLGAPAQAEQLLQQYFADQTSPSIEGLRGEVRESLRQLEENRKGLWLASFEQVQREAGKGDPVKALAMIDSLTEPPSLRFISADWPRVSDLFASIATRFSMELDTLGAPLLDDPQQVLDEQQLDLFAAALIGEVSARDNVTPAMQQMVQDVIEQRTRVRLRRAEREHLAGLRRSAQNLSRQDELLHQAQDYAAAGDFQRALQYYRELLELDTTGKVAQMLAERVEDVERRHMAVLESRDLARSGRHGEAFERLALVFEDPGVYMLPWHVQSFPVGARVLRDGEREYGTPFDIETTMGEAVVLHFSSPGYEDVSVTVLNPGDLSIHLSRTPQRAWSTDEAVDAPPLPVREDHVVVDRGGRMARMGCDGQLRWSRQVKTLSGMARAPVFMPGRPGRLLLVTEEGVAWIVDARSGELEGHWDLGSPPVMGPTNSTARVRVLTADGVTHTWDQGLKPESRVHTADSVESGWDQDQRFGSDSGLTVVRRRNDPDLKVHRCPWNEWVVTLAEGVYHVHPSGQGDAGYTVLQEGEWNFMAWEAPTREVPDGRLWLSDGAGLRAFTPLQGARD